jgi:hypothetical protein
MLRDHPRLPTNSSCTLCCQLRCFSQRTDRLWSCWPVCILFPTSNIATAWSWGPYRGNLTLDQARTLLKETLSKVNKDPTNSSAVPQPVTDADILGFQQNDYFPHFDSQQLAGGWYDKFNALQGQNNTYYASGLNGFETVEFALRAGIDIVESYF